MASEWKYVRFGDVVNCISKKINVKNADIRHYVSTDNMVGNFGGIVDAQSFPKNGSVTQFVVGDVLFSNIRTYFKKVWQAEFDGFCSNDVLVFRPLSSSNLSANYLFQICRWNRFTQYSIRTAKGVKMPRGDKAALVEFSFKLPNISEQERISEIFNIIDKKIQLNKQMNETLEQMAQALFQSWFVDFDPVIDNALDAGSEIPEALQTRAEKRRAVRSAADFKPLPANIRALFPNEFEQSAELSVGIDGRIPKGWKLSDIGHEFDVTMGQSPPGDTYNIERIGEPFFQGKTDFGFRYPKNRIYCSVPKRKAKKNDTLLSVRAPVGAINLATTECCIGRGLASIRDKVGNFSYAYYSMMNLSTSFLVYDGDGTVFGSINQKSLKKTPFISSPSKITSCFENIVKKIDMQIEVNSKQIESLTKLRDILLPKLISGELRLDQLDAVEELSQL